jgi:hypothetical protein
MSFEILDKLADSIDKKNNSEIGHEVIYKLLAKGYDTYFVYHYLKILDNYIIDTRSEV